VLRNVAQVSCTTSKHATSCTVANGMKRLHFMRVWSNNEENGKWNCVFQGNDGMPALNILAKKSEQGLLPYCKTEEAVSVTVEWVLLYEIRNYWNYVVSSTLTHHFSLWTLLLVFVAQNAPGHICVYVTINVQLLQNAGFVAGK
jgi:hypothetical protein